MSGNIEDVIDSAGNPEEAVFVADGAVSGEVISGVLLHVSRQVSLMVAENSSRHGRPRLSHNEYTRDTVSFDESSLFGVKQQRLDSEERSGR